MHKVSLHFLLPSAFEGGGGILVVTARHFCRGGKENPDGWFYVKKLVLLYLAPLLNRLLVAECSEKNRVPSFTKLT